MTVSMGFDCRQGDVTDRYLIAPVLEGTLTVEESKIDRDTMARLARALAFIRSPDDPVVVALRRAAETGIDRDIKQARTLFLKLKPADRRAALASLTG
jgi:hypothetical protein